MTNPATTNQTEAHEFVAAGSEAARAYPNCTFVTSELPLRFCHQPKDAAIHRAPQRAEEEDACPRCGGSFAAAGGKPEPDCVPYVCQKCWAEANDTPPVPEATQDAPLKPCRWCNSAKNVKLHRDVIDNPESDERLIHWSVACSACEIGTHWDDMKNRAVSRWNTRASTTKAVSPEWIWITPENVIHGPNFDYWHTHPGQLTDSDISYTLASTAESLAEALRGAVHALESYKSGNASPDLADEVCVAAATALARFEGKGGIG